MNDAAQIRRCTSALRANRPLPPTPDPKISNREPLRLEINVTQTKQTTQPHSNRELEELFSNHDRSIRHLNLKNSNRESLRLEIDVTQTKQTAEPHSNRELRALFSNRVRAVNRLCDCQTIDSARRYRVRADDSARGYIALPARHPNLKNSNRAESHTFQITINPSAQAAHQRDQLHSQILNFQPPNKAQSIKNHPQSLFRLERTPLLCFQQLTRNLNDTMFRLEIKKEAKKKHAQLRRTRHPKTQTSGKSVASCAAPTFGWR